MFNSPESIGKKEKEPAEKESISEDFLDREAYLSQKELVKEKYQETINWREKRYDKDIAQDPSKEGMRFNLNVHNEIVLDYATKLTEKENLDSKEKVEAIMATIMHDGGKLSSGLLAHHQKGVEYADEMLKEIKGKEVDGVEITDEVGKKIKEAIERHMNHPFMVMSNKGERFPEPQDKVDKVVFDADMLANIGFKNVAFRLGNKNFLDKDSIRSKDGNVLEESFRNVLEGEITDDGKKIPGASGLEDVVLSDSAKAMAGQLIESARNIFENLKEKGSLKEIQKIFSDKEGNFNQDTIKEHGGTELIKKLLNEKIEEAAMNLGIETETVKKFAM